MTALCLLFLLYELYEYSKYDVNDFIELTEKYKELNTEYNATRIMLNEVTVLTNKKEDKINVLTGENLEDDINNKDNTIIQ